MRHAVCNNGVLHLARCIDAHGITVYHVHQICELAAGLWPVGGSVVAFVGGALDSSEFESIVDLSRKSPCQATL